MSVCGEVPSKVLDQGSDFCHNRVPSGAQTYTLAEEVRHVLDRVATKQAVRFDHVLIVACSVTLEDIRAASILAL